MRQVALILLIGLHATSCSSPIKPAETASAPKTQSHKKEDCPLLIQSKLFGKVPRMSHPKANNVTSLSFSPDGRLLASMDNWGGIIIWNVKDQRRIDTITVRSSSGGELLFLPNGYLAFFGRDFPGVSVWDLSIGEQAFFLEGSLGYDTLAASPQGEYLAAAGTNGIVDIWDLRSRKRIASPPKSCEHAFALAFSPDARELAFGGDSGSAIHIWDVNAGKEKKPIAIGGARIHSLGFSPDGSLIAAMNGGGVVLQSSEPHRVMSDLNRDQSYIARGVFLPDSKRLLGGGGYGDGRANYLWDTSTGAQIRRFDTFQGRAYSIAVSPKGDLFASGEGEIIRLFDLSTGVELPEPLGAPEAIRTITCAKGGQHITATAENDTIVAWENGNVSRYHFTGGFHGALRERTFLGNEGKYVAVADHKWKEELWDSTRRKKVWEGPGEEPTFQCAAIGQSGLFLIGRRNSVERVKIKGKDPEGWVVDLGKRVLGIAISPDEKYFAAYCDDGTGWLGPTSAGQDAIPLERKDRIGGPLSFSPNGDLLVSSVLSTSRVLQSYDLLIWDTLTCSQVRRLGGGEVIPKDLAMSNDSVLARIGADGSLTCWDLHKDKPVARMIRSDAKPTALSAGFEFGDFVSGNHDGSITAWKLCPHDSVTEVAAPSDAKRLALEGWEILGRPGPEGERASRRLRALGPKVIHELWRNRMPEINLATLPARLESEDPDAREAAWRGVRFVGLDPKILEVINGIDSTEVRGRLKAMLSDQWRYPASEFGVVRQARLVRMLADMKAPETIEILKELSSWPPSLRAAREAKEALARASLP